jgi:hypothetical protein
MKIIQKKYHLKYHLKNHLKNHEKSKYWNNKNELNPEV